MHATSEVLVAIPILSAVLLHYHMPVIYKSTTHSILSSTSRPVLLLAKEEEETFRESSGWEGWEASGRREEWWESDREERWEGSGWEGKEEMSGRKKM